MYVGEQKPFNEKLYTKQVQKIEQGWICVDMILRGMFREAEQICTTVQLTKQDMFYKSALEDAVTMKNIEALEWLNNRFGIDGTEAADTFKLAVSHVRKYSPDYSVMSWLCTHTSLTREAVVQRGVITYVATQSQNVHLLRDLHHQFNFTKEDVIGYGSATLRRVLVIGTWGSGIYAWIRNTFSITKSDICTPEIIRMLAAHGRLPTLKELHREFQIDDVVVSCGAATQSVLNCYPMTKKWLYDTFNSDNA